MNGSAFRAVSRVAWRQAWRAKWRSLLVIAMVALPIAGLTGAAIIVRTATPTERERLVEAIGTADFNFWGQRVTEEQLLELLPSGTTIVSSGWLQVPPLVERNRITYFSVEEFDVPIDRAPLRGEYVVLAGRAATSPVEIAVHPDVLSEFGGEIGDEIQLRPNLILRITGTVARAGNLNESVAVLGPGTLASIGRNYRGQMTIDLPAGADLTSARRILQPLSNGSLFGAAEALSGGEHNERDATGGAFAATALLLLGTGLIAGAAFAVGARRQLRTLGLLGASGAEPRHVRATVLMGGVTLGLAGSLAGIVLGVTGSFVLHPRLSELAGRFVGPLEIPFAPVGGAVVLGTLAATLAALGPARSAARLSVNQALSRRTPPPRRPGRLAAVGLLGVAVGIPVATWATASSTEVVLTAGLATIVIGVLLAIPLLVTWTGRIAGHLPTLGRVATRDVSRHGRRTGTALAAASVALAIPVAIATVTLSDEAAQLEGMLYPNIAEDHLLVRGFGSGRAGVEAVHRAGDELREAYPDANVAAIVPAVALVEHNGRQRERWIVIEGPTQYLPDGGSYRTNGFLLVGGADLLRALHAEDGIEPLERGEIVGIGPGTVGTDSIAIYIDGRAGQRPYRDDLAATDAGETQYAAVAPSELSYVVSPERAAELGLRPSSDPWNRQVLLFRAAPPIDEHDVDAVRSVIQDDRNVGVTSRDDFSDDAGLVRTIATIAGMVLALAIVAVVVALLAAESRRDRAILVAVGAAPWTRRTVAGLYAAVVATLAGILGLLAGFFPTATLLFGQEGDYPIVVPWAVLGAVLVVAPAVAGGVGSLVSRQPKAAQLLRPIA